MFSFNLEGHESVCIEGARRVAHTQTQYQRIEIVQLPGLGETLFLDGFPQVSAEDSCIFNEVMIHPPLCAANLPTDVFIAGIGSGFGIAEVTKHSCVQRVYALDIDREAVDFYREHLSFWNSKALSDPRVKLIFADARQYLEDEIVGASLDVIVIDLPDPHSTSPSNRLFTSEFYRLCRSKLKPDGIFLTQAGRYRTGAMSYHRAVRSTCTTTFEHLKTYHFYCPCYYEPWSFLMCASRAARFPEMDEIDDNLRRRGTDGLKYYSGTVDRALSEIPHLLELVAAKPVPALFD